MLSRCAVRHYGKHGQRLFSKAVTSEKESNESAVAPTRLRLQELVKQGRPIEKISLSRGLAMNKFEKDFFIYPEYSDTDDVRNIEGFSTVLRETLALSVDRDAMEKCGHLSEDVQFALDKSAVPSTFVPAEFGGLGFSQKDLAKVFEELSLDWNVFCNVNVSHTASHLLVVYGSEEQKKKYLPLIANGKCRPAVALINMKGRADVSGECVGSSGTSSLLTVDNVPVIGAANANLVVLFAASRHHASREQEYTCYLIDRTEVVEGDKWEIRRNDTLGLKAVEVGTMNLVTTVTPDNILGDMNGGEEIRGELTSCGRLPLAAATVGHAKRLLDQLAAICNKTPSNKRDSTMMSSESGMQRCATALALRLYSLESALYYLTGLMDEGLPIVADVENALIHRLTREVLQKCVAATIEIGGLRAADRTETFEKDIRDVSSLLTLNGEGDSVEYVAMATLSSWASTGHKRISSTLKRLLKRETTESNMKNPKLEHYIAEHAHPSLQLACQELEFSMSRLNTVISKMLAEQGKNVEQDYGSLEGLVTVLQNQMSMVAVISRASRSYAVGLRNSDIELAWATAICTRLSRANWFELEAMSDYFGLVRFNPSLLNAGRAVFDLGGYKIESPTERNW